MAQGYYEITGAVSTIQCQSLGNSGSGNTSSVLGARSLATGVEKQSPREMFLTLEGEGVTPLLVSPKLWERPERFKILCIFGGAATQGGLCPYLSGPHVSGLGFPLGAAPHLPWTERPSPTAPAPRLGLQPLLAALRILCLAVFLAGQRIASFPAHLLAIHHCDAITLTPQPSLTPNWARHLQAKSSFRFSRHHNDL